MNAHLADTSVLDETPARARSPLPPLSVLELALMQEGSSAREGLQAVVSTAQRAAELGFRRVWVAEHHGYRSVGSVAPPVLATHLAAMTSAIRVGSGGVLLPHHAPLAVAEQFTTLASLNPGRVDLGIGRGPGTSDPATIRALRRGADQATDAEYRADLIELLGHLDGRGGTRVLPGADTLPEPWLLSSSVTGADLAAELGLPIAFAYHIRPGNAVDALARYRERFRPSRWREAPYALVSVETVCAATDGDAIALGRPARLAMAAAVQGRGGDAPLLSPAQAAVETLPAELEERLDQMQATQAYGSAETVYGRLSAVAAQTGADELMLSTPLYHLADRLRSLELVTAAA
ncbi:LLM class flavin-dependent oxidoreductase [Micromonospora sp. WMMD812]|uniref:LLM class flavin-dependent oxidoreductase n=1 Tax=Micromonospora sp. WMMD812 TaxID=3015152 RepID=UPI00248B6D75|nr:LLM class flavin-dependent oxidoreductase [Micromonospora sp. WMMD812]WBB70105.1 LLM class flavin-dependent oxidoreductase [Micromonospora sp. WMMD812]